MESFQSTEDTSYTQPEVKVGKPPVVEKTIIIHPEKKPTIKFEDFMKPRDIFNSLNLGPSFGCSEIDTDAQVRVRPTKVHAFVETIRLSYVHHLPLILSPDDIWIVIMQGFGIHMEQNAEALRSKFVDFEGQEILKIENGDPHWFMKGYDYGWCFEIWSQMIKENIGEVNHQTLVPTFSTTGPLQQQVLNTSLMKSMDSYFLYVMGGGCGIPKVKFLGTLDDWEIVRKRLEALDKYGCADWVNALLPVIDKFITAYQGEVDVEFWDMCFKMMPSMSSGGYYDGGYAHSDRISGWILNFFPYSCNGKPQYASLTELKEVYDKRARGEKFVYSREVVPKSLPLSYAQVPWKWVEYSKREEIPMQIITGFVGMSQDPEGFVRPQIGWSIHQGTPEKVEPKKSTNQHDDEDEYGEGEYGGEYGNEIDDDNGEKDTTKKVSHYPMDQIEEHSRKLIFEWAKESKIDISHLTNARKFELPTNDHSDYQDASMIDEEALRDVWYTFTEYDSSDKTTEITKDMQRNDHGDKHRLPDEVKKDMKLYLRARRNQFIGRQLHKYFMSLPNGQYDQKKRSEISEVISAKTSLSKEMEDLYNSGIQMPVMIFKPKVVVYDQSAGNDIKKHIKADPKEEQSKMNYKKGNNTPIQGFSKTEAGKKFATGNDPSKQKLARKLTQTMNEQKENPPPKPVSLIKPSFGVQSKGNPSVFKPSFGAKGNNNLSVPKPSFGSKQSKRTPSPSANKQIPISTVKTVKAKVTPFVTNPSSGAQLKGNQQLLKKK